MNKLSGIIGLLVISAVIYSEAKPDNHHDVIKIVNGTDADDGEFPYMVQLLDNYYGYFFCGGSIIGEKWILTAGHCVEDDPTGGSVVYGTNTLAENDENKIINTSILIKNAYLHPKFAYNKTARGLLPYYDVGLIELEKPIPFDSKAQPIKLADANAETPYYKQGVLSGWGANVSWGMAMPRLQKINLHLLYDSECSQKIGDYAGADVFNSNHSLCSDDNWNGECYGDSGSPFVVNGLQYGLVSWSFKPCGSNPGTYSRLTNPEYRKFIRNVTGI